MCKICCCDNDDTPDAVTTNTTTAHAQPPNYSQGGNELELMDTCMPHDYSRVDQNFCVQDDINQSGKSTHSSQRQDPPPYSEAILMGTHNR